MLDAVERQFFDDLRRSPGLARGAGRVSPLWHGHVVASGAYHFGGRRAYAQAYRTAPHLRLAVYKWGVEGKAMIRRAGLSFVLAMSLASGVGTSAAETSSVTEVPSVSAVRDALTHHRISEGYRLAERLIRAQPANPDALFLASDACIGMALFDEAKQYARAGLQASPSDARLHACLARIAVLEGDDAAARKEATAASALGEANGVARDVMNELDLLDRFTHRAQPTLIAGSPGELVARLADMLSRHAPASDFIPLVDRGIFADLPPQVLTGHDPTAQMISGIYDTLDQRIVGVAAWEVGSSMDGDVPVQVLFEARWSADGVAEMRRTRSVANSLGIMAPLVRSQFEGIDAADWDAVLERLIGRRQRVLSTIHVSVVKADGGLRVADLKLDDISMREQLRAAMRRIAEMPGAVTPAAHPPAYWVGYLGGWLILGLVVVGIIRWSMRSKRKSSQQ